jgi:hypothetical protein
MNRDEVERIALGLTDTGRFVTIQDPFHPLFIPPSGSSHPIPALLARFKLDASDSDRTTSCDLPVLEASSNFKPGILFAFIPEW